MLNLKPIWPSKHSVHFLHNWRCAGTTINSILSSNYHDKYLKVGHPFNIFGWPHDYQNHPTPLLLLDQIRTCIKSSRPHSVILGGHTFLGLETFLPGPFDIWMNYRDPLQRLNSGILRFYNKQYAPKVEDCDLIDVGQSLASTDLDFSIFVDRLLSSTLIRESNGISRRLASLSLCSDMSISQNTNVETVDMLLANFGEKDLFDAALANLERLSLMINSSHIQASILCIEQMYSLKSPLINPFSNLAHNPATLSGVKSGDSSIIDLCKDVLIKHSKVDLKLFPYLNQFFAKQVNSARLDSKDIAVRDAIHCDQLLSPKWFVFERFSREELVRISSESLDQRCRKFPHIENEIFDTFFRWEGLTLDFRHDIDKYLVDNLSRLSFF